jgi:uncharacterized membrane protein YfhO
MQIYGRGIARRAVQKMTLKTATGAGAMLQGRQRYGRYKYLKIFLLGFAMYLACVIPYIIWHYGIFFYYGDYNVQQVPFYILAHRAARSGNFFWNSHIDLGGSMGACFAFYLWGSPFFWFTVPFPEAWVPYMMPFLMAAKYGLAMTTSFAWIRTQTKTDRAALIAAVLYAFSGFQACDIVFQHFHEVTSFFPLYLLAFDRFMRKKEKLPFALMTAFMAILNYYFFVGEIVFFFLYFIIRYAWGRKLTDSLKDLAQLAFFGVMGVGLSAFFLVQSLGGVVGNDRVDKWINGINMVVYPDNTTPLAILKSIFYVPDLIARGTLFTSDNIRNGSLSCYLPMFAVTGVVAYFRLRKGKDWKKRILAVFLVFAFVPVLNSLFSALNSSYYARWFYLPILVMAAATGEALEEADDSDMKAGFLVTVCGVAWVVLCDLLPTLKDGKVQWFQISENPKIFLVETITTALTVPALAYVVFFADRRRKAAASGADRKETPGIGRKAADVLKAAKAAVTSAAAAKAAVASAAASKETAVKTSAAQPESSGRRDRTGLSALILTIACCLLCTSAVMYNGTKLIARTGGVKWRTQMLQTKPQLPDTETFSRVETDGTSTNYEMVWGYPTIHCFESTVTPSIFTIFDGIGMRRTVESTLPFSRIGIRQILSVRYYLENAIIASDDSYSKSGGLPGYSQLADDNTAGYHIYENGHFIPMGFTFDTYMKRSDYDQLDKGTVGDRVLVKDLILSDEDADKYGSLMERDADVSQMEMTTDEVFEESDRRAATACTSFSFSNDGFTAGTTLPKENLVFFSVPYDNGWTAYVDGVKTEIVTADFGMMAVDVPAGTHAIEFRFVPYGFRFACVISLVCAVWCVLWFAAGRMRRRRGRDGKH